MSSAINLTGATSKTSMAATDQVLVYEASSGSNKKISFTNLDSAISDAYTANTIAPNIIQNQPANNISRPMPRG